MAGEYIEFNNLTQPAINDTNLNLMQQLIKQDIQGAVSGDTLPVGAIMPFGSDIIPENWLLCDGSAVSRTTYQDLFNTIGTSYGQGDGFTTFNLPDLRGRVGVGKSSDTEFDTLGETGGEKTHTLTVNEMPSHNHAGKGWADVADGSGSYRVLGAMESGSAQFKVRDSGENQPHNNLQPYIVTNYIIKAYQTAGTVSNVIDNLNSSSSTDALSAKQGKLLGQYSTTETVVGTWIDGKPLYRKVINCGNLLNSDIKYIAHNISNIEYVVKIYLAATSGISFYNSNLHGLSNMYNNGIVVARIDNTNIVVGTEGDFSGHSAYAIVEYTKTTD